MALQVPRQSFIARRQLVSASLGAKAQCEVQALASGVCPCMEFSLMPCTSWILQLWASSVNHLLFQDSSSSLPHVSGFSQLACEEPDAPSLSTCHDSHICQLAHAVDSSGTLSPSVLAQASSCGSISGLSMAHGSSNLGLLPRLLT